MQQFFALFVDSFVIWSRNLTLVYVFLFALLLFELIMPNAGMPELELRWLLLGGIMLLLIAAIMAGWFNMVAQACDRFLNKPREQAMTKHSPVEAFTLFRHFLPGVSKFVLPVAQGYLIQFLPVLILVIATQALWVDAFPLMKKLAFMDVAQQMKTIEALPPAERAGLQQLMLTITFGALGYLGFSLLIMLWPAFAILYRENGLQACWHSFARFFRDPVRMISLSAIVIALRLPVILVTGLTGGSNMFIAATAQLLGLLIEIYLPVVMFVYVYQIVGKPVFPSEESDSERSVQAPPAI